MSAADDRLFDDWVERARGVTCRAELERRGLWHNRMLGDAGVPCPGCGGRDRFAINCKKNLFVCRRSGVGGDAIALVRHVDECSFLAAVETLTGEPPPDRAAAESEEERAARVARIEVRDRMRALEARQQRIEGERYRNMERKAAFDIWLAGRPIAGTPAAAYLAGRGLSLPPEARLKYHPDLPFFASATEYDTRQTRATALFRGPAMLAAIYDEGGFFIGVHRTWLDPDDAGANGKRQIFDPATGEQLKAKKARGSVRGGVIPLAGMPAAAFGPLAARPPRTAWRVMMGEGIETTLAVYTALPAAERAGTEFLSGVSLSNMAGKAAGRLPHPSETRIDARARARRVFVQDAVPRPDDDTPLIGLADGVSELVLLGDGDSDPFATGLALERTAARFAAGYPGLTIKLAMARTGLDFDDMLRVA